jgi:hypothetical protein
MAKARTYNLTDLEILEFSLVSSPAVPAGTFAVTKALTKDMPEGSGIILKQFVIKSVDKVRKQVFGYILVPDEVDKQGDTIVAEEVEKAAHSFMKNMAFGTTKGTGTGLQHQVFAGVGYPIQSAIDYTGDIGKGAGLDAGKPGGWWAGVQITDDEVWKGVEEKKITGFSIGGFGKRTPTMEEAAKSASEVVNNVLHKIVNAISKEGAKVFLEVYQQRQIRDDLWDMFSALETSIFTILEDAEVTDKTTAISVTIEQFKETIVSFVTVIKAGRALSGANEALLVEMEQELTGALSKIQGILNKVKGNKKKSLEGDQDMNPEDLKKIMDAVGAVGEQVKGIDGRLTTLETTAKAAAPPANPPADDPLTKALEKVNETLTGIAGRVEKLEKNPQTRNGDEAGDPPAGTIVAKAEEKPKTSEERLEKGIVGSPLSFRTMTTKTPTV